MLELLDGMTAVREPWPTSFTLRDATSGYSAIVGPLCASSVPVCNDAPATANEDELQVRIPVISDSGITKRHANLGSPRFRILNRLGHEANQRQTAGNSINQG